MACYWLDNQDALIFFLNEIDGLAGDVPSFYVDAEGYKLGRFGTLDLLQIYVLPLRETFIVDVFTLKQAAFTTSFRGISLRTLFESSSIKKVFFDVRNDSDAMFSLYNVFLSGVVDLQMMEYFQEGRSGRNLAGLRSCVERDSGLPSEDIQDWLELKLTTPGSLSNGASQRRPLSADLFLYAAGDVEYLPLLYKRYSLRLTAQGWDTLCAKTEKRLRRSRMPTYDPQGKQKGKGPYRILNFAGHSNTKPQATVKQGGQEDTTKRVAKYSRPHVQLANEEVEDSSVATASWQHQTPAPSEESGQAQKSGTSSPSSDFCTGRTCSKAAKREEKVIIE
ncbi:hypothetical protein LTR72_012116 [Exophiala xenobiotica]|nr:hypothetical protein LTR72_012116 [Exophiala xenobiotica]KAK5282053.1 hypothetical protein LTR14_012076 [Exophiala xenobiotica]